jgi:hypothetical protein
MGKKGNFGIFHNINAGMSAAGASQPDGQITDSCPSPFAKIFRFTADPNQH